ncbi:MAG TPA: Ig-like domain-containing protein, partial [Acidimicrobiales bacterium]|nr:Ig-like domain-containing protein [Acidimicrobiales bacterium]
MSSGASGASHGPATSGPATGGPATSIGARRAVLGLLGVPALVLISQLFGPSANAIAPTFVSASVSPKIQFLNDTAGTTFTFTVTNASPARSVGSVSIQRPSADWTVVDCPQAPAGWTATSDGAQCLYQSSTGTGDDIPARRSSSAFQLRATTTPGTANRAGGWQVQVSPSSYMPESGSGVGVASGGAALTTTAYAVEVLDAVVADAPATVGTACPPSNRSAITGTTKTIVLCGRNRSSGTLTMQSAHSSLGGTFLGSTGSFNSGPVAGNSAASTVLANWQGTVTGTKSTGRSIVASLGAAASQTSPQPTPPNTTFTGYEALNQPPVVAAANATTLEDQNTPVTLSATDGDGDPTTFAIASGPGTGTLGTISAPSCSGGVPNTCTATVTYTPTADTNGADSFTYTASDSFATSTPATADLTVTPVNDAPSFTKGSDPTVAEDSGTSTVSLWATSISAGPSDESSQTVTFNVTGNTNPGLFGTAPAVSSDGTLTYTPAANANGSATITLTIQDNGGTANGGADTSAPQSFDINVTAVNDAPAFTKGADETVLEDAGAQTVNGWATGISPGPADESGQTVAFNVTNNTNSALFSAGPAVDSAGNLTYTPAPNANGTATITLTLQDDGGTANGGADTSAPQSFAINVTAVNDAPTFTNGGTQTSLEDAGPFVNPDWGFPVTPGPANESSQTVTFNVTNNTNPSLFSTQPTVASDGTVRYTPAPDANGSATITVTAQDNGGTANGGADTSAPQTFTINVTAVNDAPAFTKGADETVLEDAGAQTVNGWATGISPGPADESGQTLTFNVTNNTDPSLFSAGPAVDSA